MSVSLLGQPMLIINSASTASDLLDKKSGIYSDRPFLMMGSELVGWKNTLALTPYGNRFRAIRRMLHGLMGTRAALSPYEPQIELESRRFLRRVLDHPGNVADASRKLVFSHAFDGCVTLTTAFRTAGAIILKISHGYQTKENDDPIVSRVDAATNQFSEATQPGAFLVDVIHSRMYCFCETDAVLLLNDVSHSSPCSILAPWRWLSAQGRFMAWYSSTDG
jgi:hypothetical protein